MKSALEYFNTLFMLSCFLFCVVTSPPEGRHGTSFYILFIFLILFAYFFFILVVSSVPSVLLPDIALSTLLTAFQSSIHVSVSWFCDHSRACTHIIYIYVQTMFIYIYFEIYI